MNAIFFLLGLQEVNCGYHFVLAMNIKTIWATQHVLLPEWTKQKREYIKKWDTKIASEGMYVENICIYVKLIKGIKVCEGLSYLRKDLLVVVGYMEL